MKFFELFKKKPKDSYSKGLVSSKGEEGNIIVLSGYLPDMTCTSIGVGHYEFCVIGNHMFEYSKGLNVTVVRVYKNIKAATTAMRSEVRRLQSVGYEAEVNDLAFSHNLQLMKKVELTLENNNPKLKKIKGDVCAEAGYKPFVTVQVFAGMDSQYIYLISEKYIMYEIGKYDTSNIYTYESAELASQGLTDYLIHTKSLGFTNIIHIENGTHNALVETGML